MRHVYPIGIVVSLLVLGPVVLSAQIDPTKLSVTNYQLLSSTRQDRTQFECVYSVQLVNKGPALPEITATVTSQDASIQIVPAPGEVLPGQANIHFPPVAAGGTVTSIDTFTVVVDRSGDDDFSNLTWSFGAPVANAGTNQTVSVGSTATLNAGGSSNPSGIGILTYSWAFTSRPPGASVVLQNSSGVMPYFVPDATGAYVLTVSVTNGIGTDTAMVTVNTTSSTPVANAGPGQTVGVGSTVVLDGSKSLDPDGSTLTYAWSFVSLPSRSSAVLINANTVSPSFTVDQNGAYIVQLVVSDHNGTSAPATVTINTQNTPPVANAGPNQVVNPGSVVQLDGSKSTDVDGNPLTYAWSLITLPANSKATLNNPSIVNPQFTADVAGVYVAQLIVYDGTTASLAATVTISTNSILPPTANAGSPQSINAGVTVQLSGSGTDPQALPLSYQWSLISKPAMSNALLSNPVAQNPTFTADLPGTYIAQLIVNNGTLSSAASTVTISSNDVPPTADAGPAQAVATGATVTLDGSGSTDPQHFPLTYTWSLLSAPANSTAILLSPNIVSPTFVADVSGTYVAQLIVSDGYKSSAPATVTITAASNPISLSPGVLNLQNTSGTLTVSVAAPAGINGIAISLAILDQTVATAPSIVTIPQGATSATVQVTPVGLGSTIILASSPGFKPVTATINVGMPSISLSLSANTVGVTKTVTGTVTLSGPAPAGGLTVTLAAGTPGIINIPSSVPVAGGATSGTFSITGVLAGVVGIAASAPNYVGGSISITVGGLGAISVQSNLTVDVGQSSPLSVTLISPAPVGGVTVTLVSSDTTKLTVTPSITFAQGATTPQTPAQVNGLVYGSAAITASASGFTGDSKQVQVGLALGITPSISTLSIGNPQNITVTLSGPAPNGGVQVTMASDNTAAATVPASIMIGAGQTSALVSVTPAGTGSANLTASSTMAGISTAIAKVIVVQGVVISTSSLPIGIVGAAYNATVNATGGTSPYSFSATGLPAGLSISAGGVISGTPTSAGTGNVSITVNDSSTPHLTATANVTLTVNSALSISTTSLPTGTVNVAYSAAISAAGGIGPYTFSSTGLPVGLTMNASGAISGTPTAAGNGTVVVTVTDSESNKATVSANIPIRINAPLAITTTSLPAGTTNVAYSASVAATGGTTPYSFSATGLPAGLSMTAAGAISGTVTTAGTSTVVVTVNDSTNPHLTATATLSLAINPPPLSITTTTLPNGAQNIAYSAQIAATGGTTPYTFSATGLPAGLSISAGGLISGTPTVVGTAAAVAITVTDSTSPTHLTATANFSITINPPTLAISTTSLPNATSGQAYSASITTTGGTAPFTFSASGLPTGLSITPGTGAITGTTTALGTGNVTFTVTDSSTPTKQSAMATLSLTVVPPPLRITTASLPGGTVGVAYSATVTASGGTPSYTFSATGLPQGLTINTSTGQITGSPTTAGTSGSISITVTDLTTPTHLTATANYSVTIAPPPLAITTTSLPGGAVGTAYSTTVAATGGTNPYSFSATGLPSGLSINPSTGVISGSPTTAGTVTAAITVTDSTAPTHMTATANLQIAIAPATLAITTTSLPQGVVGTAYSATVAAGGGTTPYSFSATGLPGTLSINASSGVISGTPTSAGSSTAVITVTDATTPTHMSKTANLVLTIVPPPLVISTTSLPNGTIGVAYSAAVVASGGTSPYSFSATGLPAGININAAGQITGTPTSLGTTTAAITVTDQSSPRMSATANLSITIAPPPLTITTTTLPSGTINVSYLASVGASGGTSPYTFSAANLPSGLTITASGAISGTPTAVGTTTANITVTDSATPVHNTKTVGIPITINPPLLVITTAFLNAGTVGTPYAQTLRATGGTPSYSWSLISGTLPNGLTLNSTAGTISGTPTVAVANLALTLQVKDSGSPAQTATQAVTLTIAASSVPTITVTGGTIGQNLQIPITVTLNPAPAVALQVTVSSSLPALTTLAGPEDLTGAGTRTIPVDAGQASFFIYAQGLASTGTVTLTASASQYANGTSTITLAPSGFVIAGPNGVGASFTVNQGSQTTLTVSAAQLDNSNNFVQAQQIRVGATAVPITVSNLSTTAGSVSPPALSFTSGTSSMVTTFTANETQAGSTVLSVNVPSGFSAPANNGNSVPVTVQTASINPSNVTVGANLENTATVALQGVAPNDLFVTITTNDPTKFLLSTDGVTAGANSIMVKIKAGLSTTPPFYVYGIANSGSSTYTATAPGFGTADATVSLAPSGFAINSPFGLGANFFTTTGTAPSSLQVLSGVLDNSGNFLTEEAVAGGSPLNVTLTSLPASVGTITSPVTFTPGTNTANAQFQPVAMGTATITAVAPSGFSAAIFGSVTATVIAPKLAIDNGDVIGVGLEQQSTILLGAAAPAGGLQVTLTSDTPAGLAFSATGKTAGTASLALTIPAGQISATYFMQGLTNSGAVTVTASAPGYNSGTGIETLANSAVVIAGPFGVGFPASASVSAGPTPLTVTTMVLDSSNNPLMPQPVGTQPLSVQLTSGNPSIGTIASPVSITSGNSSANASFTPILANQSVSESVTQPPGFTIPSLYSSVAVNVGP